MKVTMKDIAKKLNVSINAVSIALNDKPGVSDEMRLLILKTADEMGYINEKRKYLSVFSKSNIAIMMQSYYADTGHFYSIVLRSIVEEAKSLGYFSIMNYFDDSNMELPECIVDRKVAGIVIVGKISDMNLNQLKDIHIGIGENPSNIDITKPYIIGYNATYGSGMLKIYVPQASDFYLDFLPIFSQIWLRIYSNETIYTAVYSLGFKLSL